MNGYQPCHECGELEADEFHSNTGFTSYHEYEPGCYCGQSGRCEVCVERAVDAAEAYGDALRGK